MYFFKCCQCCVKQTYLLHLVHYAVRLIQKYYKNITNGKLFLSLPLLNIEKKRRFQKTEKTTLIKFVWESVFTQKC